MENEDGPLTMDRAYIPGMARGDGRIYWRGAVCWIAYWHRGVQYREAASRSRGASDRQKMEAAARRKLHVRLSEIHGGRFVGPAAERVTINDCLALLIEDLETRGALSVRNYGYHIKPVRASLGLHRVSDLTTADVQTYQRDRLEAGKARATVNREVEALRQALTLARRHGRIANPPYLPLLRLDNARQGWFDRKDLDALCVHLPWHIAEAARFSAVTGWRKGEILPLAWAQVDRARGEIRLATSKNRRPRAVPIAGELAEIIERCWRRREYRTYDVDRVSRFVFHRYGRPVKDIAKPWARACEIAGINGRLFHDLRRTAAKDMADAGVDQVTIMEIMGHRTDAMFRRYRIVTQDRMREALEGTRKHLAGELVRFGTGTVPARPRRTKR